MNAPIPEEDFNETPTCTKCGEEYSLDYGMEPTKYCHECAHEIAESADERIAALEQECGQEQKLREEWRAATLAEQSKVTQLVAEKAILISERDQLRAKVERMEDQLRCAREPAEKIALAAAKEIDGCFDIEVPRGRNYVNGILQTIRIIIQSHLMGESREQIGARRKP